MVIETKAKTLLSSRKEPDPWFGCMYTMNVYRGCQHQCIYCDSRSECYQIENFSDVIVKVNAAEQLEKELLAKRRKGTICTGAMSDPYQPLEKDRQLSRRCLEIISRYGFPLHTMTKSDLILRDADLLKAISNVYCAVSFTITTVDDELGKKLEPGAALPSERLAAMKELSDRGIYTGVTMMPVLPFIEDTKEQVIQAVDAFAEHGACYMVPSFGMTLRDRQRVYYYRKIDTLFPGLRNRYVQEFGDMYSCGSPNARELTQVVNALGKKYQIPMEMDFYVDEQMELM